MHSVANIDVRTQSCRELELNIGCVITHCRLINKLVTSRKVHESMFCFGLTELTMNV